MKQTIRHLQAARDYLKKLRTEPSDATDATKLHLQDLETDLVEHERELTQIYFDRAPRKSKWD